MSSSTRKSADSSTLKPAAELARASGFRFPNESAEYRRAREALLMEEIELRRHIERVAEQRRSLPPGGEVKKNYAFEGENGPASFADLFGDKDTLVVYNYMYGPQRERPCPMCTSLLSAWDGEVPDVQQRVALAVVARSPELAPAPPAVPALTPAQLRVERIHVEIEARGHAIEGNHEGLSVRFAGAEKSQH